MEHKCINSGKEAKEQHHVIPLALGGEDIPSNKVWLCSECHAKIHGRNIERRGTHWKELQRAGIERAKAEGKYIGRKPLDINEEEFRKDYAEVLEGKTTLVALSKKYNCAVNTLYRRIEKWGLPIRQKTKEQKQQSKKIHIQQLDKNKKIIQEFDSIFDAGKINNIINLKGIEKACNNGNQFYGYYWQYIEV